MTGNRLTSILVILGLFGCQAPEKFRVDFVDRNDVFHFDQKSDPLTLVVEIGEDGKLRLNRIETGTIDDTTELSEKLKAIFDDRKHAGMEQTEVTIDPQPRVETDDLEKLVTILADLNASPIRVVRNDR